jgi:hypothetical protein
VISALSSSPLVDVFISHDWPSAITELSSVPFPSSELPDVGSPPIDEIIEKTKPRYIFISGGEKSPVFWEREPFTWADETDRVSRFVSLGAFVGEPVSGRKQRVRTPCLCLLCTLNFCTVVLCVRNYAPSADEGSFFATCECNA